MSSRFQRFGGDALGRDRRRLRNTLSGPGFDDFRAMLDNSDDE